MGKQCVVCVLDYSGTLYDLARDLNCNKIALGHHTIIETYFLNLFLWQNGGNATKVFNRQRRFNGS